MDTFRFSISMLIRVANFLTLLSIMSSLCTGHVVVP
jgi:hypothetical protein